MSAPLTDYEQKIIDNVARTGCHWTMVFDPDGEQPSFAYSTGFLETVGQSEIIIFGLSKDVMGYMVNETLHQCRGGFQLENWGVLKGLLQGHRCILREVRPENVVREYFNSALWYHHRRTGQKTIPAFQIVWPGAEDGLFPWDQDCADIVKELQPPLYEARLQL